MNSKKNTASKITKFLYFAVCISAIVVFSILAINFLGVSHISNRYQIDWWSGFFLFIAIILGNLVYDLLKNLYPKKTPKDYTI
jgi:hypothetical protein